MATDDRLCLRYWIITQVQMLNGDTIFIAEIRRNRDQIRTNNRQLIFFHYDFRDEGRWARKFRNIVVISYPLDGSHWGPSPDCSRYYCLSFALDNLWGRKRGLNEATSSLITVSLAPHFRGTTDRSNNYLFIEQPRYVYCLLFIHSVGRDNSTLIYSSWWSSSSALFSAPPPPSWLVLLSSSSSLLSSWRASPFSSLEEAP